MSLLHIGRPYRRAYYILCDTARPWIRPSNVLHTMAFFFFFLSQPLPLFLNTPLPFSIFQVSFLYNYIVIILYTIFTHVSPHRTARLNFPYVRASKSCFKSEIASLYSKRICIINFNNMGEEDVFARLAQFRWRWFDAYMLQQESDAATSLSDQSYTSSAIGLLSFILIAALDYSAWLWNSILYILPDYIEFSFLGWVVWMFTPVVVSDAPSEILLRKRFVMLFTCIRYLRILIFLNKVCSA